MATESQRTVFRHVVTRKRGEADLTQEELAERVGVSRGTVSEWERGASAPRRATAKRLELVLGTEPDEICGLLGFAAASSSTSVAEAAIEADEGIPAHHKRTLLAHLAEVRKISAEEGET